MSTTDDHDRPAVPRYGAYDRMALRDHFAGLAMAALIDRVYDIEGAAGRYAATAYYWADAMLKARKGGAA